MGPKPPPPWPGEGIPPENKPDRTLKDDIAAQANFLAIRGAQVVFARKGERDYLICWVNGSFHAARCIAWPDPPPSKPHIKGKPHPDEDDSCSS